jgi:hypothetical protein
MPKPKKKIKNGNLMIAEKLVDRYGVKALDFVGGPMTKIVEKVLNERKLLGGTNL